MQLNEAPKITLPPTGLEANFSDTELTVQDTVRKFTRQLVNANGAIFVGNHRLRVHPIQLSSDGTQDVRGKFAPSYLQVVDEIPKTASEKPRERFLLDAFDLRADNIFTEQTANLSFAIGE